MAKFTEVIECLKNGGTAQRIAWDVTGDKEIMMQIPQRITKDIPSSKRIVFWFLFYVSLDLIRWGLKKDKDK